MRAFVLVALGWLSGCGDDATNPADTGVDSVAVDAHADDAVDVAVDPDGSGDAVADAGDAVDVADAGDAVDVSDVEHEVEVSPGAWRWESLPPVPEAIQENAVVFDGEDLWVIGGFQGFADVAKTFVYDVGDAEWRAGPALPEALHHANAAYVGGRIWIVGALQGLSFGATGATWSIDPHAETPTWSAGALMDPGTERGSAAVAVSGDAMLIAGGLRLGDAVTDVSRFNPDGTIDVLPELPAARDHVVAAAVYGKLYVLGGRDTGITALRDEVWVLDPAAEVPAWSLETTLPTARGGASVAVVNGLVLVLGGEGNDGDGSGVFLEVEAYDPVGKSWTTLPPMPTPRHGTGAAGFAGAAWVPGGADVQAFGAVDTFERLIAPTR